MSRVAPHKHKASDVVETQNDYLLPYLRSLRDPSKIERTIIEGSEPLPEGTAFPTEPFDDQFFRLTQDITGYPAALYRYDGAADEWIRLQPVHFEDSSEPSVTCIVGDTFYNTSTQLFYVHNGTAWIRNTPTHLGSGTSNPSEGMIKGDTFYRTDEKKLYTYNGSAWATPTTGSHDGLTDVGLSDHHAAFTSTNHENVEHLAGLLNQALQPYNSNITFARKSGQEDNGITYTSGEIKFQDGTTRTITSPGELLGMPVGDNYIYFKTDSAILLQTTSHVDAISSGRGLLAIIIVASDSDPDIPCAIQPFYAKGLNLTADTLAVTLLSAITAYLGNVEIADGRIILGDTGIIGRDAEENVRFYISTDGRAYFGAGDILLDEDGMNVNDGDVIIDTEGIKISGTGAAFKILSADKTLIGYLGAPDNTLMELYSALDMGLAVKAGERGLWVDYDGMVLLYGTNLYLHAGSGKIYTYDSFRKHATVDDAEIELGTPTGTFRYFVPRSTAANRPAAAEGIAGLVWATRETDAEERLWLCTQNAGGAYIWQEFLEAAGGGDMFKAIYDTDLDGVVDDSELVGSRPESDFLLEDGSRAIAGILKPDADATRDLGTDVRHFSTAYIKTVWSDDGAISVGGVAKFYLGADGAWRWHLDDAGLFPILDNAYDIGDGSHRVKQIFCATLTEGDHVFTERTCPVCGAPFLEGESISNYVISVGEEGTRTIPMHARCGT